MEKLISKDPITGELTCSTRDFDKFFPTLYAYEETGFAPADILTLERNYESLIRKLEETTAELASIKHERNTMAAVLKKLYGCGACTHYGTLWNNDPCFTCRRTPNNPMWEWRCGKDTNVPGNG